MTSTSTRGAPLMFIGGDTNTNARSVRSRPASLACTMSRLSTSDSWSPFSRALPRSVDGITSAPRLTRGIDDAIPAWLRHRTREQSARRHPSSPTPSLSAYCDWARTQVALKGYADRRPRNTLLEADELRRTLLDLGSDSRIRRERRGCQPCVRRRQHGRRTAGGVRTLCWSVQIGPASFAPRPKPPRRALLPVADTSCCSLGRTGRSVRRPRRYAEVTNEAAASRDGAQTIARSIDMGQLDRTGVLQLRKQRDTEEMRPSKTARSSEKQMAQRQNTPAPSSARREGLEPRLRVAALFSVPLQQASTTTAD